MWDLIASVPDHCSSFYFSIILPSCLAMDRYRCCTIDISIVHLNTLIVYSN